MRTPELPEQPAAEPEATALTTQADFFDDASFGIELANLDKPETKHGKYTGAELDARVVVRDRVVRLLAEGMGIRRMAKMLRAEGVKIGEHSILALRERRPDLVATEKKQLSQQLGRITKLMGDQIEERLIDGSMKATPIDMAVMVDKKAAVDGEAGLVIEHRFTVDASADAFAKKLEEMRRAKVVQPIDCESIAIEQKPQ
jgi:hypothetical protein